MTIGDKYILGGRRDHDRLRVISEIHDTHEPGLVDVSYSRWLMVHFNKPIEAMLAIHTALKPGGVMVCEEADVSKVYAEPISPAYEEIREIALEAGRRRGVDCTGGRKAHSWALEVLSWSIWTPAIRIT